MPGLRTEPADAGKELSRLIEVLRDTDERLEALTAGEVDTVADHDGRTYLLRRAQYRLRDSEAAKQAGILNALQAHIALVDPRGVIVSVNDAWRNYASANGMRTPDQGLGFNYLEVCDAATGDEAAEAQRVASGIRAVLEGREPAFSLEYPCPSPTGPAWFLLKVTPLAVEPARGAVVMHLEITDQKLADAALRRFGAAMDAAADAIYVVDRRTLAFVHVNEAACRMQQTSREELLARGPAGLIVDQRADLERLYDALIASGKPAEPVELQRRRRDGTQVWVEVRRQALLAGDRWTIVTLVRDVTDRRRAELALRESERRISDMLQNIQLLSLLLDTEGRITDCNPYLLALTGWDREDLIGQHWIERMVPPEAQGIGDVLQGVLTAEPAARHHENEILTRSGARRLIRWNNAVLRSATGEVTGTASIGEDITERREARERILYLNRVYAMLSGINGLIVRVRDRAELFRGACELAVAAGGFQIAWIGVVGPDGAGLVPVASTGADERTLFEITQSLAPADGAAGSSLASRAVREKRAIVANDARSAAELPLWHGDPVGDTQALAALPLLIADDAVGVLVLHARERQFFHREEMVLLKELADDIAFAIGHIATRERLDYLAYYDELTGLANRTLFLERVAQYLRSAGAGGHRLALLVLDIERFRNINDSFGRTTGDALLKEVARWLAARAQDVNLLARVGPDQFALVVPRMSRDDALSRLLGDGIDDFLQHSFALDGMPLRVAIKAGVAIFPGDGATAGALFANAEAALKKAKVQGHRYLFYAQQMNAAVAARVRMENQLRQALQAREFVLHYQPKVSALSGLVVGAEALLRWNDPHAGLVAPMQFIPILEETGLIREVGSWAMGEAIQAYLRWQSMGLTAVRIAVNVSPLQLRSPDFADQVARALDGHPLAASGLQLEITESLIMEDLPHSIESLRAIREMGVTIALDDFGTGFSSLSHLATLPVDLLKIDRSFVAGMATGPGGPALVAAIVNLAHAVGLEVVAEGVETEEQARLLRLLECDQMQGFLFSRPLPAALFESAYLCEPHAGQGARQEPGVSDWLMTRRTGPTPGDRDTS